MSAILYVLAYCSETQGVDLIWTCYSYAVANPYPKSFYTIHSVRWYSVLAVPKMLLQYSESLSTLLFLAVKKIKIIVVLLPLEVF